MTKIEKTIEKTSGYLGAPPKYKYFSETKKSVANLSIATGSRDNPVWKDVQVWNKMAEKVKNLPRGTKISIEGTLEKTSFTNKKGETVEKAYIQAKTVDIHKLLDITAYIGQITKKHDTLTELFVIENKQVGEKEVKNVFTVNLWNEQQNQAEKWKVGDPLRIKGDGRFTEYKDKDKNEQFKITITPKEITHFKNIEQVISPPSEKGMSV